MRKLEIFMCAHLLVRCAIDAAIVVFHFFFSSSAHARPQNRFARPLGYPRGRAYASFPKNAKIFAKTLKMRNGCVIHYFTPRRARELRNKEIERLKPIIDREVSINNVMNNKYLIVN